MKLATDTFNFKSGGLREKHVVAASRVCPSVFSFTWNNSVTIGRILMKVDMSKKKGKGKSVPLQAWSGPEGCRKLRFPDYMTTAQDGGKVVSLTHRPPLPPKNAPVTHFC
jgi:hypothetical protein